MTKPFMASTPTAALPVASPYVDPLPPVVPMASSLPMSPRTATNSSPASPNKMEDSRLEEPMGDIDSSKDYSLHLEMEFDSEKAAYDFYNEHGRVTGFSIRKGYSNKSQKDGIVVNRKFVCSKEGEKEKDKRSLDVEHSRKDTRTKCNAFMYIAFNRDKAKWIVTKFEEKHNHPLHLPQCVYKMRSQRSINEAQGLSIELAVDSGLSLKASHDLISAQSGGRRSVGFTREDHKTYFRVRRQRSLEYGEAGALLGYFQTKAAESPYFYYRTQLDVDQQITNIFWADYEMITDYGLFGDSLSYVIGTEVLPLPDDVFFDLLRNPLFSERS